MQFVRRLWKGTYIERRTNCFRRNSKARTKLFTASFIEKGVSANGAGEVGKLAIHTAKKLLMKIEQDSFLSRDLPRPGEWIRKWFFEILSISDVPRHDVYRLYKVTYRIAFVSFYFQLICNACTMGSKERNEFIFHKEIANKRKYNSNMLCNLNTSVRLTPQLFSIIGKSPDFKTSLKSDSNWKESFSDVRDKPLVELSHRSKTSETSIISFICALLKTSKKIKSIFRV